MSSVVIAGDTSGSVTLQAPAVAGSITLTLPSASGTVLTTATGQVLTSPTFAGSPTGVGVLTLGTAVNVASPSGFVNLTGIPSWVQKITVMFNGVETNGTSPVILQLGYGATPTYVTTGYSGYTKNNGSYNTGFFTDEANLANRIRVGEASLSHFGNNQWTFSTLIQVDIDSSGGGISPVLTSTLTAIRMTTVSGADDFTAGSINIMYE